MDEAGGPQRILHVHFTIVFSGQASEGHQQRGPAHRQPV